ncbi:hypothetical protein ABIC74_000769 [Mucilaginibacter rubeus]|uniref:S1/P1 nuclease n=1 Tax=Mucilaginibacter rubeus TaxID=2027860 RepID=UPI0033909FA7
MKQQLFLFAVIATCFIMISWGYKGHRSIARIAQIHFTKNTAYAISLILKDESMADISTWADDHKNPATSKWHFVNLPLGLSHDEFFIFITRQTENNIYTAILKEKAILLKSSSTAEQKNKALKYLIHLIGDAHQPMHVSRAKDKGGNRIQVRLDNKGTNLHKLWDRELLDYEALSEEEIVRQYDKAGKAQIKQWQADIPIEWLWESYQLSSELYANIKPGQKIDDALCERYIQVVRLRIDQAGIRLAGELNRLFDKADVHKLRVSNR